MKESSGELSMTVVVIVGAVALVGLVGWLLGQDGPAQKYINDWFNTQTHSDANEEEALENPT